MAVQRINIIEPSLLAKHGHPYWFPKRLRDLANARGLECRVFGNKGLASSPAADFAEPYFSKIPMIAVSDDPIAGPLEDYLHVGAELGDELATLVAGMDPDRDAVLFTTCYNVFALAIARCAAQVPRMPPSVVTVGMPSGVDLATGRTDVNAVFYRYAFNRLPTDSRLVWAAVTAASRDEFAHLLRRPVELFPDPVVVDINGERLKPKFDEARFTVLYQHSGHAVHGPDQLPGIVAACRSKGMTGMRFIQLGAPPSQGVSKGGDIEVLHQPSGLPSDQWRGVFEVADIVLHLPDPGFFRSIQSSSFLSALMLDRPVLTVLGTEMAKVLRKEPAAGMAVQPDANSVAEAIFRMQRNIVLHKRGAASLGAQIRAEHGVEKFFDRALAKLNDA